MWSCWIGAALLTLVACGPGVGVSPTRSVSEFAAALRDRRFDDAYAMMSRSYRRRVPREEFRRHLEANPQEASDAALALAATDGPAEETAVVSFADGEELTLVREGGRWRIADNVVDFYDQTSPRAALQSFVRALERRRFDVVLRFAPAADREGMTVEQMEEAWSGDGREEIERLIANLRAHLDEPIEEIGDRATMRYGERFSVHFVREEGLWRIEDPE